MAGSTLDIAHRRGAALGFTWKSDMGRRTRGLGLADGDNLLAASIYTGGAAYGLVVFNRVGGDWRGRWITSIDGGGALGEMSIQGDKLPGRHSFSGRGRVGGFEGSVNITQRGSAFLLNFTSSGGVALYRGIGAVSGDRLVVAWSFGGNPSLALYGVTPRGLTGQRFAFARGQTDAAVTNERLTREGMDDTIFPPMLPTPAPH